MRFTRPCDKQQIRALDPEKNFAAQIIFLHARPHRRRTLHNLLSRHSNNYRLQHRQRRQMIRIDLHVRVDQDRGLNCLVRCDDQSYSKRELSTS